MTTINGDTKKRLENFVGLKTDSLAIHGGQSPDPTTGAVIPPIFQTSTYAQRSAGVPYGEFEYSRSHNPTRRMLEDALALMEGGVYGLATASGMNATALIVSLLAQGDEIICCDDVYGGTYRIFTKMLPSQGIKVQFADLSQVSAQPEQLLKFSSSKTKMVWIESPTNPLLKLIDIKAVSELCKKNNWILVVDNTFMSPIFQRPLELGADIVVHSLTKYINGHSDVVAGAVITRRDDLAQKLYFNQNSSGAMCSPFDSWLVIRSLKTLPVRMRAHEKSAMQLAQWLSKHSKVEKVIYPGLESHPHHELAKRQMHGFGGMLSFYLKGGLKEANSFFSKLKLFTLAESLGGVESLIEHPAIMTHASLPTEVRAGLGITDSFIRVSVGLEDIGDLKNDLEQAFA